MRPRLIWRPRRSGIDRARLNFHRSFIRRKDLVFDVGANIGEVSAIYRSLGATVVAVEPQPECVRKLTEKFGRDNAVTIVPAALGSERGSAPMWIADGVNTISTLSADWTRGRFASEFGSSRMETVPVETLDALIAEHGQPDFVKLDVEGFEPQVLRGLTRPVRLLSFEWVTEGPDALASCIDRLLELGQYEFSWTSGAEWRLCHPWTDARSVRTAIGRASVGSCGDVYARRVGA